ncbi:hypothetical protein [Tepidiforma sp.]|uniref:hypothetical protein n=1 Tax=Tepidiforma sp. TaxID=2682230 RepID=UPI002ADE2155|nr:hypothetical protein [Tepidiforma sp.]
MHIALRTALDRLLYEGAVVIHMLNLAPADASERQVDETGRTVGTEIAGLAASLQALAAWIEGAFQPSSGPQPGRQEDREAGEGGVEALRVALRRLYAAALAAPGDALHAEAAAALWEAASVFTASRERLLMALPESAPDAVVRRWQRAPAPPPLTPVDVGDGAA